jgi:hypothetical protein
MTWKWEKQRSRLHASNPALDLASLRSVISRWLVGTEVEAVVYETSAATFILRGPHLHKWMSGKSLMVTSVPCPDTTHCR